MGWLKKRFKKLRKATKKFGKWTKKNIKVIAPLAVGLAGTAIGGGVLGGVAGKLMKSSRISKAVSFAKNAKATVDKTGALKAIHALRGRGRITRNVSDSANPQSFAFRDDINNVLGQGLGRISREINSDQARQVNKELESKTLIAEAQTKKASMNWLGMGVLGLIGLGALYNSNKNNTSKGRYRR